ncbi:hypothetical protein CEF21_01520 [Bacillus sp. FJAT-42376]|nr:hypothetical protein CEF21_01520 [Bacillus sp. FJAT-42376]
MYGGSPALPAGDRGSVPEKFTVLKLRHHLWEAALHQGSQANASVPGCGEARGDRPRASPQEFYRTKAQAPSLGSPAV